MVHLYTLWEPQKNSAFLTISGGMEMEHWLKRIKTKKEEKNKSKINSKSKQWKRVKYKFGITQFSIFHNVIYSAPLETENNASG